MNMQELARLILSINAAPLNRIRFAKTIYFVHKELIRKGMMQPEDISYIRSPLGPVPEGFLTLALAPSILLRKTATPLLSFDAEEYLINPEYPETSPPLISQSRLQPLIKRVLDLLNAHSTTALVEASHDPSWLSHPNGVHYLISTTDLKNMFPFPQIRIKIRIKRKKPSSQAGALQANLLRGMLKDIVQESTDLEYPDQPDTNKSTPKQEPS